MSSLISPEALRADYDRYRVLDVQYVLGGPTSEELYAAGHLPGAALLRLEGDLAGPAGEGGRHPLPDSETVRAALQRCGVSDGDHVVVYDQGVPFAAARAWWVLRYFGLTSVRALEGGLAAWQQIGGEVSQDTPTIAPGTVSPLTPGHLPLAQIDDAAAAGQAGTLWDVRAAERYRGEVEPIDPVAGHIPGARNAPATELSRDGRFLPATELTDLAIRRGITEEATLSCGSGVTAAQMALALDQIGWVPAVYIGSWSQWSASGRPVATGTE